MCGNDEGAALKQVNVAPCLGVEVASGTRRLIPHTRGRFLKAEKAHLKTKHLHFMAPRMRVYNTMTMPQQAYPAAALGVPMSTLRKWRTRLAQYLGAKRGWCSPTVIALEAQQSDPVASVHRRVIQMRLESWWALDDGHDDFRRAWQCAVQRLSQHERYWAMVRNPIASTVATLMDLKWKPMSVESWTDHNSEQ